MELVYFMDWKTINLAAIFHNLFSDWEAIKTIKTRYLKIVLNLLSVN